MGVTPNKADSGDNKSPEWADSNFRALVSGKPVVKYVGESLYVDYTVSDPDESDQG